MLNALTVDLEDWFQVSNVACLIAFEQWGECEARLSATVRRLLKLLAAADVRATFFVLGWNAEHFPALVQEIAGAGHEVGSHGYAHQLVFEQSPAQFQADLTRATTAIHEACGVRPSSYRAPSFSITADSGWALAVLAEQGFRVDSSVFPVLHERYGFPGAPRLPYRIRVNGQSQLVEAPPSTLPQAGHNHPFAGGANFRLHPYPVVRSLCRCLNRRGEPVIFYLHPWELDPGLPRFPLSRFRRLRSYANLHDTERRLTRLLRDLQFGTLSDVLSHTPPAGEWCVPHSRGQVLLGGSRVAAPAWATRSRGDRDRME